MTKKRSLFGALPQLHIPQKSHANTKPPPRPKRTVVKDLEIEEQASVYVLQGFCRVLPKGGRAELTGRVGDQEPVGQGCMKENEVSFLLPKIQIIVDNSFRFTGKVLWLLFARRPLKLSPSL